MASLLRFSCNKGWATTHEHSGGSSRCHQRVSRPVTGPGAVRSATSSSTVRAPTCIVRAQPNERDSEVAQVPETARTAPTHQDPREDLPEHLVADVSEVAAEQQQQQSEPPHERYGSQAAAAEKAPDSDQNQDYEDPLAGEGASAAD